MDFNKAETTCYRTYFPYAISGEQNVVFWCIVPRVMRLTYTYAKFRENKVLVKIHEFTVPQPTF